MRININYYDVENNKNSVSPTQVETTNNEKTFEKVEKKQTLSIDVGEVVSDFVNNQPIVEIISIEDTTKIVDNIKEDTIIEEIHGETSQETIINNEDKIENNNINEKPISNKSTKSFKSYLKNTFKFIFKTTISAFVLFVFVLSILHFFN